MDKLRALRYEAFAERLFLGEPGHYDTFEIRVLVRFANGERVLDAVHDIPPDAMLVSALAVRCNRYRLYPIHMADVAADAI